MEIVADYLETYEGRDKFLRTLSYTAKFVTILPKSKETSKKFKEFGSRMSDCRVMLRLLDDIPTIHYVLTYGWGKQEPDRVLRWLELMQNLLDVVYSPIETICWLAEKKFIRADPDSWDNASTWFWIISLSLSFFKSSRKYYKLSKRKNETMKRFAQDNAMIKVLNDKMKSEILVCTRMILDLSYAISYLPRGTLWGEKLSVWQVGALGTISSVIGLYQALSKRAASKKNPD